MPIIRLPGGSLRDEIRQPLYDSIDILAAAGPQGIRSFFSAVQGKSKTLTNLRQNNLLETAVSYRVQGMAIDCQNIYEANIQALALIQESSNLNVRIGEKVYWEGPMTFLGGRLKHFSRGTTDATYQHLGAEAVASVVLLGKHVVDINPLQSFRADWEVEGMTAAEIALATLAANTKLRFIFSFKGLQRRPVQ